MKRIRRLLRFVSFGLWLVGNWINALAAFGLLIERTFKDRFTIPWQVFFCVTALTIIHGLTQTFGRKFIARQLSEEFLTTALHNFVLGFPEAEQREWGIRCNVMNREEDRLVIAASCKMDNEREKGCEWSIDQGVCGMAVRKGHAMWRDLGDVQGLPFHAIRNDDDHQPRWGLTEELWSYTRDLGSVVSIPLFHPKNPLEVIGVFNIDTQVPLLIWLPEDRRDQFMQRVQPLRGLLAWMLYQAHH